MKAIIYKPAKHTMQSGRAGSAQWVLEYEAETPRRPAGIMGWTAAGDTLSQVRMRFSSREAAVAFAESHGLDYVIQADHARKVVPRSYLDNFKFRPVEDNG